MTTQVPVSSPPTATVQKQPALALKHKPRWRRFAPVAIALVIIVCVSIWGWKKYHPVDNGLSGLITDVVKRGDLIETVSATGAVNAQTGAQVKIGSQITGRIKKLNADVGSIVKAGAIIAELDLPDIEAQLAQARANLAAARLKQAQFQSGVLMQQTQINSAIVQARAGQVSAAAKLNSAQAAANQQIAQTPTDIDRAQNVVASANAALSTAQSNLTQIEAGIALQVANSQQQVNQAIATSHNSDLELGREQALLAKGYVAGSIVDQAQATATVNKSLILSAQQNLALVTQKNTADLQSGKNLVTQAAQDVKTAGSALVAAKAESFLDAVKLAAVGDARAVVTQGDANLSIAQGNTAQNIQKQQDIRQAMEAVAASTQQVAYAQAQVDKTFIKSPISGTVLQLAAQQGETLAAGLSSPTLIVVADLNRLQVDAYVDETDIGKVKIGQSVIATVDAFPTTQFTGRVSKIASGSTIQVGVITYDVTIAIDNLNHQLKPDMTASVTIQTGKRTAVLLTPSEAVKIGTNGLTVNVLTKTDGSYTTTARTVTTGGEDGVNTEILTGLKEGETIILAGVVKAAPDKKASSAFGGGGGRGGGGRPGGGR